MTYVSFSSCRSHFFVSTIVLDSHLNRPLLPAANTRQTHITFLPSLPLLEANNRTHIFFFFFVVNFFLLRGDQVSYLGVMLSVKTTILFRRGKCGATNNPPPPPDGWAIPSSGTSTCFAFVLELPSRTRIQQSCHS